VTEAKNLKELNVYTMVVGPLATNCYLVYCGETGESAVIDPGFGDERELELVMKWLEELSLRLVYIIDTHGHPDHVSGNKPLKARTGAPILIHHLDEWMLSEPGMSIPYWFESSTADMELHGGEKLSIGECTLTVLHTPGHTMGSVTLLGDDVVFTGDTLFAGSIGRIDLPGASPQDMEETLREKILSLPDDVKVYPGHGPATVMGVEKRVNPFLRGLKQGKSLFRI